MKLIYGKLAEDINLRTEKIKILLSDLLDTEVTWLKKHSEANALVGIRQNIRMKKRITSGFWVSVESLHIKYFAQSYAFCQASYQEALEGSLGNANTFARAALARWGHSVPGPIYCWLVDIHTRALRAHIKTVAANTEQGRWVRALDWRSPFPVFGKGSRITHAEYLKLIAKYRSLRDLGYPPVQPVLTPGSWNIFRRQNEIEHRNDNENGR